MNLLRWYPLGAIHTRLLLTVFHRYFVQKSLGWLGKWPHKTRFRQRFALRSLWAQLTAPSSQFWDQTLHFVLLPVQIYRYVFNQFLWDVFQLCFCIFVESIEEMFLIVFCNAECRGFCICESFPGRPFIVVAGLLEVYNSQTRGSRVSLHSMKPGQILQFKIFSMVNFGSNLSLPSWRRTFSQNMKQNDRSWLLNTGL